MDRSILEKWHQSGLLGTTDLFLAELLEKLDGGGDPLLAVTVALVSRIKADGHVCLDLQMMSEKKSHYAAYQKFLEILPQEEEWRRRLRRCAVVGRPGDYCPLVLDDRSRLYFYRYWQYEKLLADAVIKRSAWDAGVVGYDRALLEKGLNRLFPDIDAGMDSDWQKIAAAVAGLKRFCVISGGPGTGKTHTVAKILALLLELHTADALRIRLAAPTGKAAAKLGESIQQVKATLDCPSEIRACIPEEATTVHRLLQARSGGAGYAFDCQDQLPVDIVVVDEASMIDLALMSNLTQALPDHAHLILLGDKDQLASVEAGSVLGDICDRRQVHGLSAPFRKDVEALTGQAIAYSEQKTGSRACIRDSIVHLVKSYRFVPDSGIGALSRTVNAGAAEAAIRLLRSGKDANIQWVPIDSVAAFFKQLKTAVLQGYRPYLNIDQPEKAIDAFQHFRILCAVTKGPFGVDSVNRFSEQVLQARRLIRLPVAGTGGWYPGRPVLITHNDYSLGLYNGDIGLALVDPQPFGNRQTAELNRSGTPGEDPDQADSIHAESQWHSETYGGDRTGGDAQSIQVLFGDSIERYRRIPAYRIGRCQTAYAMTVHKSQGSEFDQIHLVLPDTDSPIYNPGVGIYRHYPGPQEGLHLGPRAYIKVGDKTSDPAHLRFKGCTLVTWFGYLIRPNISWNLFCSR